MAITLRNGYVDQFEDKRRAFWPCRERGIQKLAYHDQCSERYTYRGVVEVCICGCHI